MSTDINTLNLADNGDGMVPLNDTRSTSFTPAFSQPEKNVSENKQTMDSTPINDIMMEAPMMMDEPRMQGMMPQMTAHNLRVRMRCPKRRQSQKARTHSTSRTIK